MPSGSKRPSNKSKLRDSRTSSLTQAVKRESPLEPLIPLHNHVKPNRLTKQNFEQFLNNFTLKSRNSEEPP